MRNAQITSPKRFMRLINGRLLCNGRFRKSPLPLEWPPSPSSSPPVEPTCPQMLAPVAPRRLGGDYTKKVLPELRQVGWTGYWIDAASTKRMDADSIIILDPVNRDVIDKVWA